MSVHSLEGLSCYGLTVLYNETYTKKPSYSTLYSLFKQIFGCRGGEEERRRELLEAHRGKKNSNNSANEGHKGTIQGY